MTENNSYNKDFWADILGKIITEEWSAKYYYRVNTGILRYDLNKGSIMWAKWLIIEILVYMNFV